jgi:hypothetical protein
MSNVKTILSRLKRKVLKRTYWLSDRILNSDKLIRYTHFTNGFHNPNYQFKKEQIASVHIPKTGGTTLNKMLLESGDSRFVNLNIHKPISINCNPESYNYITVMRDPIDRVWSQYQMVLRSENGYPYQKFAQQGLFVFLEKCWAVRNMNCRYISGEVEAEPNAQTLKKSIVNLSNFYAVLSFEDFSNVITCFLKENKIAVSMIPNERKSSYIEPTEEEINLIKKYNEFDLILFDKWKNKGLKAETT